MMMTTTTTTMTTAYPTRYYTQAVSMERQQLQQQQSREKRKMLWYYYHSYGSHWTIHYSSHLTYTILKVTSHHHEWSLQFHPCTKSHTNMSPSYKTINSITILYVYAWNTSVVTILVGTDEHGHDNKFNKEVDIIQHINAIWSFRRTHQHNHI